MKVEIECSYTAQRNRRLETGPVFFENGGLQRKGLVTVPVYVIIHRTGTPWPIAIVFDVTSRDK